MRAEARGITAGLAFGAAAASVAYTGFAIVQLVRFGQRVRASEGHARFEHEFLTPPIRPRPSITVLKPVRGPEPRLEQNLRSFCAQDYPAFDVVLGVRDPDDPALPLLRRIAAEFPGRASVVVGDRTAHCRNPKIATLLPMLERATGEIIVVADSDMRVTSGYLGAVAGAFDDPRAGAATAIYRGEPAESDLASALGAMWITEQFAPSVLVAAALEPLTYCFGSTMAVRRTVLEMMGGLAVLGDHLADDHRLGTLVTALGYNVALVPHVVENIVAEPSLRALVRHELRWARTIRSVRPASYPGILLTYPVPLALAHFALARDKRYARVLFVTAMLARLGVHVAAHGALRTRAWRRVPARLVQLRDLLGLAVWALGLRGHAVRWRDDPLQVEAGGKLAR